MTGIVSLSIRIWNGIFVQWHNLIAFTTVFNWTHTSTDDSVSEWIKEKWNAHGHVSYPSPITGDDDDDDETRMKVYCSIYTIN